jgi:hypothetical protein
MRQFIDGITGIFTSNRTARAELRSKQRQQALSGSLIHKRDTKPTSIWDEALVAISHPVSMLGEQLAASDAKLDTVQRHMRGLADRLSRFDPGSEIPINFDVNVQEVAAARDAWPILIAGSVLLACFVAVNTGMLGQILRDGIIPNNLTFASIPLYWILALLLTLGEAGTGFLHTALGATVPQGKPPIGALFAAIGAVCIAFVEGFFYSRIGANRPNTFTVPIVNITMPFEQIFFLWGFVLVLILFGIGIAVSRSIFHVRRGRTTAVVTKRLRKFHDDLMTFNTSIRTTAQTLSANIRAIVATHEQIGTLKASYNTFLGTAIQNVQQQLEMLKTQPPAWATAVSARPEDPDFYHLELRAAVVFWLTLALLGVLVFISTPWLASLMTGLTLRSALLIGAGYSLLFPAAGLFLRATHRTPLYMDVPVDQPQLFENVADLDRLLGIIAFAAVVVFGILSLLKSSIAPWIMSVLIGAVLVICGREMAALFYFIGIHLGRISDFLVRASQRLILLMLWLVYVVIFIVEQLTRFLAAPVLLIFRQRLLERQDL